MDRISDNRARSSESTRHAIRFSATQAHAAQGNASSAGRRRNAPDEGWAAIQYPQEQTNGHLSRRQAPDRSGCLLHSDLSRGRSPCRRVLLRRHGLLTERPPRDWRPHGAWSGRSSDCLLRRDTAMQCPPLTERWSPIAEGRVRRRALASVREIAAAIVEHEHELQWNDESQFLSGKIGRAHV